jgi:hypothetical protein
MVLECEERVWPGNETLGLPQGLNMSPLGLGSLLGLAPGTQCGDFVACGSFGPVANGIVGVDDVVLISGVTYGIGVTIYPPEVRPGIVQTAKEIVDWTSQYSKCLHQFIEDVRACKDAYPPGPARDECHKKANQKFDLCKGGGPIP